MPPTSSNSRGSVSCPQGLSIVSCCCPAYVFFSFRFLLSRLLYKTLYRLCIINFVGFCCCLAKKISARRVQFLYKVIDSPALASHARIRYTCLGFGVFVLVVALCLGSEHLLTICWLLCNSCQWLSNPLSDAHKSMQQYFFNLYLTLCRFLYIFCCFVIILKAQLVHVTTFAAVAQQLPL